VAEARGARRHRLMVDIAVEGLVHREDQFRHGAPDEANCHLRSGFKRFHHVSNSPAVALELISDLVIR
jgi:hypothetical protein